MLVPRNDLLVPHNDKTMDKKIKKMWASALRSGDYKKGLEALHPKKNSFCALGVLCDLYMKDTGKGAWILDEDTGAFAFKSGNKVDGMNPPPAVLKWAGIKKIESAHLMYKDQPHSIVELNDETKMPFKKLADLIETSL
jgi:hypothetical protein